MTSLRSLARMLGGEVCGNQILAPAMGHSRKDRSLCVRPQAGAPKGLLVHCFGGGDPLAEKDRILDLLGTSAFDITGAPVPSADDARYTARALAIWDTAGDPRGTPVEAHLHNRGLTLPKSAAGQAIRYHSTCPFKGHRTPAMVSLVRDIRTNEPKAIHRTALTLDGRKTKINGKDRLALGPVRGGAIKLTPDEDVTVCLGIGEGIETALSLQWLPEFGPSPVWSLVSAQGIETFPPSQGIECLWIAVDNDDSGTGQKAARTCAHRWRAFGAHTFLVTPCTARMDLNDLLSGECNA